MRLLAPTAGTAMVTRRSAGRSAGGALARALAAALASAGGLAAGVGVEGLLHATATANSSPMASMAARWVRDRHMIALLGAAPAAPGARFTDSPVFQVVGRRGGATVGEPRPAGAS